MIYENIVQLIGKTPIVKLNKMTDEESAQIYLKLENLNPSGSIKDRASLGMINEMEKSLFVSGSYRADYGWRVANIGQIYSRRSQRLG